MGRLLKREHGYCQPAAAAIDAIAKEKVSSRTSSSLLCRTPSKPHANGKTEALRARFNQETGQLELYAVKKIVDEVTDASTQIRSPRLSSCMETRRSMEIEFPPDGLPDRAQTAKQVIFQKVREAEREASTPNTASASASAAR